MNNQVLTADHGFSVGVLVPGWIGAYSIKWVQDIEVSCKPIWVRRNTESYILESELWPAAQYAPAKGEAITRLNIKSSLASCWPASLSAGLPTIHGYARSPGFLIASVCWSDNQGQSWNESRLGENNEKYAWRRFEFDWLANPGERILMTKTADESGQSQPLNIPFNNGGYLYNAIHPHPVTVS